MAEAPRTAVIFDVDGVLLELTRAEEDLFFLPFEQRYGLTGLSRDWNSYAVRNDERIVAEIFAHHGLPGEEQQRIIASYHALLEQRLASGDIRAPAIAGGRHLLEALAGQAVLGVATANFREAARLRLSQAGLWHFVEGLAFGADGSGHKHETVARAIAATSLPPDTIVYIGDNLNDLEAGLRNGVHFIGFNMEEGRRAALAKAGAVHVCGDHRQTLALVKTLLRLD